MTARFHSPICSTSLPFSEHSVCSSFLFLYTALAFRCHLLRFLGSSGRTGKRLAGNRLSRRLHLADAGGEKFDAKTSWLVLNLSRAQHIPTL